MKLTSPAFQDGCEIPYLYTCDGADINPELRIEEVPLGTKSLVLIVDDPDATRGIPWEHWLVWNIEPTIATIKENSVPEGAVEGRTSFGRNGYGGPCPPKGSKPHRYMFKLYALDKMLDLDPDSDKLALEKEMEGHVLDQALLIGVFNH